MTPGSELSDPGHSPQTTMHRPMTVRALRLLAVTLVGVIAVGVAGPVGSAAGAVTSVAGTTTSDALQPSRRGGPEAPVAAVRAAAFPATAADNRMVRALNGRATTARFGTGFSGVVMDAASDRVVWQRGADTARMPASTTKLVTATNALTVLGPGTRYTTTVRAGAAVDRVVVVGAGDPTLTSAQLDAMARTTASALIAGGRRSATVYVDDDVFPAPTLATGWKPSYVPDAVTAVRGLVRDQRDVADTGADAGIYFTYRLVAWGLPGAVYSGRANADSRARVYASSTGATVSSAVSRMLLYSDNEIAESLHKLVGIKLGHGASWAGARSAQLVALTRQGLGLTALHDGSGLSRSDRLTPRHLARIVDRGLDPRHPELWPMRSADAMPTAGRTGTLSASSQRFVTPASRCAAGKVWAKTGRLSDVVALAGWTTGTDGRVKVFAFLVNGRSSTVALKQEVDMLAATVNGCI
jgi:serine-type D-Ala-D-Ala carboxypeptidase/endopeptidase (penicillin-binding protein 4)